jgi:hypothetical protein
MSGSTLWPPRPASEACRRKRRPRGPSISRPIGQSDGERCIAEGIGDRKLAFTWRAEELAGGEDGGRRRRGRRNRRGNRGGERRRRRHQRRETCTEKTPARLDPRHTATDTWDQPGVGPTPSATHKKPKDFTPTRQIHVAAAAVAHSGRTAIRTERNKPTNQPKKTFRIHGNGWMDGWVGWWWAHRAAPLLVRIPILERKAQEHDEQ